MPPGKLEASSFSTGRDTKGLPDGPGPGPRAPVRLHPAPLVPNPVAPHTGTAPSNGFDAKGDDSETDEPSETDYEVWMRSRDRKVGGDPAARAKQRATARTGWAPLAIDPNSYIRSEKFAFDQAGGTCNAVCDAFVRLRLQGYSTAQTIDILKRPTIRAAFADWQISCRETWNLPRVVARPFKCEHLGLSLANISKHLGKILESTTIKPSGQGIATPLHLPDIYHFLPTGEFREISALESFCSPRMKTLTESLFQFMQVQFGVAKRRLTQKSLLWPDGVRTNTCPTPFVYIHLAFVVKDEVKGHMIVADFSNPDQPGIFDPNFGWMAPEQGLCFLSIEQMLFIIWTYYSHETCGKAVTQGIENLIPMQAKSRNAVSHATAYQLHLQSRALTSFRFKPG